MGAEGQGCWQVCAECTAAAAARPTPAPPPDSWPRPQPSPRGAPAKEVDGRWALPQRAQQVLEERGPGVWVLVCRQRHHRLRHLVAQEGGQAGGARAAAAADQPRLERGARLGRQRAVLVPRQGRQRLGAPEPHLHVLATLKAVEAQAPGIGRGAHLRQVRL